MGIKQILCMLNVGATVIGVGALCVHYLKESIKLKESETDNTQKSLRLTPKGRVLSDEVYDVISAIMTKNEERAQKTEKEPADKLEDDSAISEEVITDEAESSVSEVTDEQLLELVQEGTLKELIALDGVGKTVAQRIIAVRPIESLEDLQVIPYCPVYISKKK